MFDNNTRSYGRALRVVDRVEMYGARLLDLQIATMFTKTATNAFAAYPLMDNQVDRPALALKTAVAAAAVTDGFNFQLIGANGAVKAFGTDALIGLDQSRQRLRMKGSFYLQDCVNADFLFGWATPGTTAGFTEANDFIGVRKLKADTSWFIRSRDNGGTAKALSFAPATQDATWLEYDILAEKTGAQTGRIKLAFAVNPAPGNVMKDYTYDYTFTGATGDQFPTTNGMLPILSWRVGNTSNTVCDLGAWGWDVTRG